jgi:hypothetical protein
VLRRRHIAEISPMPAGAYVKSVQYAGRPTAANGFEMDGQGTLEITLGRQGAAQLRGTVLDGEGKAAPFAMVVALPADGGPAESARDVMADAQGNFVFPALRPGTYKALAWEVRYHPLDLEAADPGLPMLVDQNARTVMVSAGAPATVSLTINRQADVNRARAAAGMTPPKDPQ